MAMKVVGYENLVLRNSGGMGQIYSATSVADDVGTTRHVAIKVVKSRSEYIEREAEISVTVKHPNIVAVHEAKRSHSGELCLIMEWIDGVDLDDLLDAIAHHERRDSIATFIIDQLLNAIVYLHTARDTKPAILHLDISPRNIRVSPDGFIKLIDHGIARYASSEYTYSLAGKLRYMSRSQFGGQLGPQCDLFALGVVLQELLDDQPARRGSDVEIREKARRGQLDAMVRDDIPEHLAKLCARLTELDEPFASAAHAQDWLGQWAYRNETQALGALVQRELARSRGPVEHTQQSIEQVVAAAEQRWDDSVSIVRRPAETDAPASVPTVDGPETQPLPAASSPAILQRSPRRLAVLWVLGTLVSTGAAVLCVWAVLRWRHLDVMSPFDIEDQQRISDNLFFYEVTHESPTREGKGTDQFFADIIENNDNTRARIDVAFGGTFLTYLKLAKRSALNKIKPKDLERLEALGARPATEFWIGWYRGVYAIALGRSFAEQYKLDKYAIECVDGQARVAAPMPWSELLSAVETHCNALTPTGGAPDCGGILRSLVTAQGGPMLLAYSLRGNVQLLERLHSLAVATSSKPDHDIKLMLERPDTVLFTTNWAHDLAREIAANGADEHIVLAFPTDIPMEYGGAAVLRTEDNYSGAIAFLEHLLADEAQQQYLGGRYSIRDDLPPPKCMPRWQDIEPYIVHGDASTILAWQEQSTELIERLNAKLTELPQSRALLMTTGD
jgi:serine/threonine protein kinase